jgi:hypothetical protein
MRLKPEVKPIMVLISMLKGGHSSYKQARFYT